MSATSTMPSTRSGAPSEPARAKIDTFVTVVAPLRNNAAIVQQFVRETVEVLERTYAYFELLLIDDGSSDETVLRVQELLDSVSCIRLIRLSRQFGDEIAIYAGLENAIGDFIVSLMPATDPPELIPEFVDCARRIGGVVVGSAARRGRSRSAAASARNCFTRSATAFLRLTCRRNRRTSARSAAGRSMRCCRSKTSTAT